MKAFLTLTMVDGEKTYAKTVQIVPEGVYLVEASPIRGLVISGNNDAALPTKEMGDLPVDYDKTTAKPRMKLYCRVQVKEETDDVLGGLQGTIINMDFGEYEGEKCVQVKIDKDPTSEGYQVPKSHLVVLY